MVANNEVTHNDDQYGHYNTVNLINHLRSGILYLTANAAGHMN